MQSRRLVIAHTESSVAWGGQEIRIFSELQGMQARGHRTLLAAKRESEIYRRANDAGFETLALGSAKWSLPFNAARLARWLRRHRVDVVNPHSSQDGWAAGIGGRLAGCPLIIRSRHFDTRFSANFFKSIVFKRLADHLITTSPKVTKDFQQAFGLGDEKVSTIPTGVDLDRFNPDGPSTCIEGKPEQHEWPVLGMVAVIRQAKGHRFLVRAARMLADRDLPVRLVFVGDGPSRNPVDEEIRRLNLEDRITFTGYRQDIPEILRGFDAAVVPSLHESIPQVGLQAMACGVPVVGSDAGGIPDVIKDGVTGRTFSSENAEALADALESLLRDREKTKQMRQAALDFVRREHSLSAMLDRLEQLYARLLPG